MEVARGTDRLPVPEVTADLNSQSVRFVYAFQGAGQTRLEFTRNEICDAPGTSDVSRSSSRAGGSWARHGSGERAFDYRVTSFLQASMNYDGEWSREEQPVHTARAEVRAFF